MRELPILQRAIACILGFLPLADVAVAQASVEWDAGRYNPEPLPDDLILPMPCGGAMAFRPVPTPSDKGPVSDARVTLGSPQSAQVYMDGARQNYVGGPLAITDGYGFFLGKYELAEAQFAVVMEDRCQSSPPRRAAFRPAVNVSQGELRRFAERYSEWLLANHSDLLPTGGNTPGFLRLPTDAEWEYAARGGIAVNPSDFGAQHPVGPDGVTPTEMIVSGDTSGSDVNLSTIGSRAPNMLGLHDMLGNAAEIVETPFQMVINGRNHGAFGGLVLRGGDGRFNLASLSSARRDEVNPYPRGRTFRSDFAGGRVALSGVIVSRQSVPRIEEGIADLQAFDESLARAVAAEEALAALARIASQSADIDVRTDLLQARATLQAVQGEQNILRDRALRMIFDSAVLNCDLAFTELRDSVGIARGLNELEALLEAANASGDVESARYAQDSISEFQEALVQKHTAFRDGTSEYASTIEVLAADYSPELLGEQLAALRQGRGLRDPSRQTCFELLEVHVDRRASGSGLPLDLLRADFERAVAILMDSDQQGGRP